MLFIRQAPRWALVRSRHDNVELIFKFYVISYPENSLTYNLGIDTPGRKAANKRGVISCAQRKLALGPALVDVQQPV